MRHASLVSRFADVALTALPFVLVALVLWMLVRETRRARAVSRRRGAVVTVVSVAVGILLVLTLLRLTATTVG